MLLFVAAPRAARAADDPVDKLYQSSIDQYEHGDYADAAHNLKEVIDNAPTGFDRDKVKRAWLYRGISLYLTGDKPGAQKSFWQVLLLDPEFRPDPLFTLPTIIETFDAVRSDHKEQLANVPRNTRRTNDVARDPLGIPLGPHGPGADLRGDFWTSLEPFGLAQLHNRQSTKGYSLMAAEAGFLAVDFGTWISFQTLRKPGSHFHPDEVQAAKFDKTANNAAFVGLVLTLVYGAVDGLYYGVAARPPARSSEFVRVEGGPGDVGAVVTFRF
jgi:hypothetical protein